MEHKCNLILDSCCDLPFELVDREDVQLIRFPYSAGGQDRLDDLWKDDDYREFYKRMREGDAPTTAQVPPSAFDEAFEAAARRELPSVYLSFTSGMSSSFEQAQLAADRARKAHPGLELHVVDTLLASTAEAVLAFEALRQQDRGLGAAELAAWAEEARYFVNVYFMVEDLGCLHRGGRIPGSVAIVGEKLNAKPILTIAPDGTLEVKGIARGRKKGLRRLAEYYEQRAEAGADGVVHTGHADCEKDMRRLQGEIVKAHGDTMFVERAIGPVIGSHVGPGMVSLCFWGTDRREDASIADRIARKIT